MYVVPIRTMIDLCKSPGILPAHEEVMAAGKLVRYAQGMGSVVFFSHTWLGWKHPDPRQEKKRLIVEILEGVLDGSVRKHAICPSSSQLASSAQTIVLGINPLLHAGN